MDTVLVGEVLKPHGVKGEMKVYPLTHDSARFKRLSQVILTKSGQEQRLNVIKAGVQGEMVSLLLEGIDTVEKAESYRGWEVRIDRSEVPPLQEGWYHFELEGMDVFEGTRHLGKLVSILETGANDVYIVQGDLGEICIPALKTVVKNVDVAAKRMEVVLPPGLLEDGEG